MQAPRFVRPITDPERLALEAGRRGADAFTMRRSQILLASAEGRHTPAIADGFGCRQQTVRNAIHAFNQTGLAALKRGSARPHTIHPAFDAAAAEGLRDLLHRTPRDFDLPTSLWTLDGLAAVSFAQGLTTTRVSGETVRATLVRLGVRWRRAKAWIHSPDPAYPQKKDGVTG